LNSKRKLIDGVHGKWIVTNIKRKKACNYL